MHLITSRCLQRQVQRVGHIFSPHGRAELPGDNVAAVIVEDRAEIEPAPSQYLELGEVGLPKLVDGRCFVLELIGRLQDNERRAGDQVMRFERAVHCRF